MADIAAVDTPILLEGGEIEAVEPKIDVILPRQLVVDMSLMTIGDIALLDEIRWERKEADKKGRKAELPISKFIDFLDRVVEGGIKDLPSSMFEQVIETVMSKMEAVTEKATEGNSKSG